MKGETLAPIGSLKRAGVVAITDDGDCVQSNELMRRAIEYAKMFDLPVMDHCQDQSMTEGAVMNEGDVSIRLGLRGWPNAAEDLIVSRNVILSRYTGAHIHMQHISSALSVEIVRRAKADGVRVTAEATPHHIALTDEAPRALRHEFQDEPPAEDGGRPQGADRGPAGRDARLHRDRPRPAHRLREGPGVRLRPNGIIGLETALAVVLDVLVRQSRFTLPKALDLMTRKPAGVLGLAAGTLAAGAAGRHLHLRPGRGMDLRRQGGIQQVGQLALERPDAAAAASRRRSSTAGSSSRSRRREPAR